MQRLFAAEQHSAQEAPDKALVFFYGILTQPIDQVEIYLKKFGRILREIGVGNSHPPGEATGISLGLAHDNVEKRADRLHIPTHKGDFVIFIDGKREVFEQQGTIFGPLGQSFYPEYLIANFAFRLEGNVGVLTR
jgi:hypothetical protein